ncbi:glycosyl transferase [Longispora fulva]|nr:glycosyl transferase [Longispora fulva]
MFTMFPSPSHFNPMVPLAWACRAAGHEVAVASTPALAEAVVASGLPYTPVGVDRDSRQTWRAPQLATWHEQDRWPDDWPIRTEVLRPDQRELLANLGRQQCVTAEGMVDDLVAFGRRWRADLVVHDAVSFAGPVAAAALGVPNVSSLWGSPGLQRLEMSDLLEDPLPEYERLFARFGVPTRLWPSAWVDPCPPSLNFPAPVERWPVRYVPYNGPGLAPEWTTVPDPARPRVCVTWGATAAKFLGAAAVEPVHRAVRAAAGLDVEVVVATTETQRPLLEPLASERVRLVERVPLHRLLPTCAAVLHHGGSGTTLTAATYGVPQLTVTRRPEPTLNGQSVVRAGAGAHRLEPELPPGEEGVALLRSDLLGLLEDPGYAAAADRLRAELAAQPPPSALVAALEGLTSTLTT